MALSLSTINSPSLVAAAGASVLGLLPLASDLVASLPATSHSLWMLQCSNAVAFAINWASVSVPGRIDGQAAAELQQSRLQQEGSNSGSEYQTLYSPARGRTLVAPAPWAFAIWGPIYLGELAFCTAQFFPSSTLYAVLPQITPPFVAANIIQSLWCAAFRPSYNEGWWPKYVSAFLLGGTAFSLSQVHMALLSNADAVSKLASWLILPLTMHFGWTTAATLVNLNGSLAMDERASDALIANVGHASAVVATFLGVGVTLLTASPPYGYTVAWALAACADGMKQRLSELQQEPTDKQKEGVLHHSEATIAWQKNLCWIGSAVCFASSVYVQFLR
jgi:hypothetical protein